MPAKAQPIAATTKESTTAGPALSAAAMPVSENKPAPMIAPMPRAIKLNGPSVFLRCCSPPSASALMRSSDFVSKRLIDQLPPPPATCTADSKDNTNRKLEFQKSGGGIQKEYPFFHSLSQGLDGGRLRDQARD